MSEPAAVTRPYHLGAGDGPALWHVGAHVTFKATSRDTDEQLWLQEIRGGYGYAPPLHRHSREDEAFYVLDGRVAFHIDDEVITAERGSFVWAPRGVSHSFCVESYEARFLALSSGVLDRFFFETGVPATGPILPPQPDEPPDLESLVQAAQVYGVELLGPPPVPRP